MFESSKLPLEGLRIIDLADEKGVFCSKLFADLGADVIKVERPEGDASRNISPFMNDDPHFEKSLYFAYNNTNKRSIWSQYLQKVNSKCRCASRNISTGIYDKSWSWLC
jgi:crotonobetainyl-CoA:carnitine CoA-transferase CaiB-like acyl-CoA transferase